MLQILQTMMVSSFMANALNFLVYAAIVVLFLICVIKCVLPVVNTRRVLTSAIRQLKKGENSKRSWQDDKFLGTGALFPHWSEYLNNLLFADGEFHNPSAVDDYINEDTAIYSPGRAPLADAMPGLMVSLGFLGTLIGFANGLAGFDLKDAESVMRGISQLLPGMQYAFTTSIVGVIASITATLLIRMVNGSAHRTLNNFYAALDKHAGVQSVDPMTQIAIYQQEQTALIQRLTDDITGPMTDRLSAAIDKSILPIRRSIEEFMNYTTRDQLRGVDMLVQRFMQAMNETLNGQFQKLSSIIESTTNNQTQLQQNLSSTVTALSSMSGDLIQVQKLSEDMFTKFDSYMDKINGSYQMVDEGYARIAANVEHLEIIARQQNGYLQSVGKLQTEIVRSMDNFQTSSEAFMKNFESSIGEVHGSLADVAAGIKKSGDSLEASHKKLIGGVNKDIDRTYNTFFENVNKATEQLNWTVTDVQQNIQKLPELLDGTSQLYAQQADRLTDALRQMQASLDEAVDRLGR